MSTYKRVISSIEEEHGHVVATRVMDNFNDSDVDFINTLSEEDAREYVSGYLDQVLLYMDLAEETSALA